jgi:hypothetical protein
VYSVIWVRDHEIRLVIITESPPEPDLVMGSQKAPSARNQSILAVLARAGLDPRTPAVIAAWLALPAIVAAVACRGMRRALAASEDCR